LCKKSSIFSGNSAAVVSIVNPRAGDFVFAPPAQPSVPVAGGEKVFPVRRIYCVGRNYREHIREMGGDEREPPFFFQKPTDSIVLTGSTIAYPPATSNYQYEVELVLAIGRTGRNILVADAHNYVFGTAVGIDLTRRDLQMKARDAGRPWESGKSFDESAPVGAIHALSSSPLPREGRISLSVNGVTKQDGDLRQMIWQSDEVISQLSGLFTLQPGDLIFTGTPAGIGKIEPGDSVEGTIEGLGTVTIVIK
jgi:fumarylpyruvate hydrolase